MSKGLWVAPGKAITHQKRTFTEGEDVSSVGLGDVAQKKLIEKKVLTESAPAKKEVEVKKAEVKQAEKKPD